MKKLLLLCVFAVIANMGFSQTEKGKWIVSGSSSLTFLNQKFSMDGEELSKTENFNINFGGGRFIIDNLALVASCTYTSQSKDDVDVSNSVVLAGLQYYINLGEKTKLYGEAGIGSMSLKVDDESESGFSYGLGGGLAIFLSEKVALNLGINYIGSKIEEVDIDNTGFAVGISIFF